jgi:hypothetical protein
MVFFISACDDYTIGTAEVSPNNSRLLMSPPTVFYDEDELISEIGFTKFSEFDISERPDPDYVTKTLQNLEELYKPGYIDPDFTLTTIPVSTGSNISLHYDNVTTGEYAKFIWSWSTLVENATKNFFGRAGESIEYMKEHNGISYAVIELIYPGTDNHVGYSVGWAQHGHTFRARLSASFTLDEVLAFCDAQPVIAWELDGNAMSVSAQGISELSIFEGQQEIVAEGETPYKQTLYRQTPDGVKERVGYRWEIDGEAGRYQYVLQPGDYSFSASTAEFQRSTRRGEPGPEITVKHFIAGEVVSSADYTEAIREQSSEEFTLMVTENPQEIEVLAGSAAEQFR